jgi:hypothetical protein
VAEQDDLVEGVASEADDAKIVTIISADAGWRAVYGSASGSEELSRIIAWALVDDGGSRRVVGLVVDPQDRTNIVPATDSQASQAGPLARYGFKDR